MPNKKTKKINWELRYRMLVDTLLDGARDQPQDRESIKWHIRQVERNLKL